MKFEFPLTPRQRRLVEHKSRILWNGSGTKTGKTAALCFWLIKGMLAGEKTAWVGPWFLRSRASFDVCKGMLLPFINARQVIPKEGTPLRISAMGGGVIDFYSADNPQSLYGANYSKVVVDEASRCPEEIYAAGLTVISATSGQIRLAFNLELGSRNWAIRNLLRVQGLSPEQRASQSEDFMTWPTGGDAEDNLVDPELIRMLRAQMPESLWRSLYLAEIPTEDTSLFRNLDQVFTGRELEGPVEGQSYLCGIDLGRKQDWTVCVIMNEAGQVVKAERFNQVSWTLQAARCAGLYAQFKCREAHVDASGIGDPIIEEFEKHGMVVKPFIFTAPAKKALIEGLVVECDGAGIRIPATGETFRIMRHELEGMECILDGASVKYAAPASCHDDCVMALALATHGYRALRGGVLGVLDHAKRLLREIAEGARNIFGELIHKPEPKPVAVQVRAPKETRVDNYAASKKANDPCPNPDCKSTSTIPMSDGFGGWVLHCNQCRRDDGKEIPRPIDGNLCWVPDCGLRLVVSGGALRCQNHGQLPSPDRGGVKQMSWAQYNRRRNRFGR